MTTTDGAVSNRTPAGDRVRFDADLAWERAQEKGLQAFKLGEASDARQNWAKALEIAERHFERGDPRLAASYTNHGFAVLRQGQIHQANSYFQRATAAWDDAWRWIPLMKPPSAPEEADGASAYDQSIQDRFYGLVEQGKAITEAIWREQRIPEVEGDEWCVIKPKGMSDIRRLFAAVFLMPTASS